MTKQQQQKKHLLLKAPSWSLSWSLIEVLIYLQILNYLFLRLKQYVAFSSIASALHSLTNKK